ncbi:MAG: 2-hydroxyglutaryl-CoA dehydratase, partial [Deltaproteobacteria bacterium]|nr:2-hydroxyglutaryl-CoA dehydratase [Deltaproteobacteria bacterium]
MQSIIGKPVGITATVPVEIILAAGMEPVDLNNLFISSELPERLVTQAEAAGFSHGICAWIKGIYATVLNHHIKDVICVMGGDCSNT